MGKLSPHAPDLDLGRGAAAVARTAARRVESSARVDGLDVNASMLAMAPAILQMASLRMNTFDEDCRAPCSPGRDHVRWNRWKPPIVSSRPAIRC